VRHCHRPAAACGGYGQHERLGIAEPQRLRHTVGDDHPDSDRVSDTHTDTVEH
jgi:hypothetical protein